MRRFNVGGVLVLNNRPISTYRFPCRALTLCPQLCTGIQPVARFPARSADGLPATVYGHFTQAIYRNRPITPLPWEARRRRPAHGVAAQVESESKTRNWIIKFQCQALSSRHLQRGFQRVNLHRPTMAGELPTHGVHLFPHAPHRHARRLHFGFERLALRRRCLERQGLTLTLVHFSAQPEPFLSLKFTETTQRVPQTVLTASREVHECEPLPSASLPSAS
jgi:hypothetical protein